MFDKIEMMELYLGAMSGEKSEEIFDRQAKRKQRNFTKSEKLPIIGDKYSNNEGLTYKDKLTAMGIVVGDNIDDLFMSVVLPEGWSIKSTDHSMYLNLVDNKGYKRASIFISLPFMIVMLS